MRRELKYILLGLLAPYLAACSQIMEEDNCLPYGSDSKNTVVFTLILDNPVSSTRVTWGDEYEGTIGTDYEEMIETGSLKVVIYEGETYKGEVGSLSCWRIGEEKYQFAGEITSLVNNNTLVTGTNYRIMVFANCPGAATGMTAEEQGALSFNAADISPSSDYIPMWGVKTQQLTLADSQDLGEIDMLRAVGKIEIALSDEVTDFTLSRVSLSNYNASGYSLPFTWQSVTGTKALSHEYVTAGTTEAYRGFNPKANDAASTTTPLPFTVSEDGSSAVIYLPEYDNVQAASEMAMSVTVKDASGDETLFENAIMLRSYDNNGEMTNVKYNLVRNHYYKYTIAEVLTGYGLVLTCTVQPWDLEEETLDYENYVTMTTDGQLKWTKGIVMDEGGDVYLSEQTTGSAECTFTFATPQGGTWIASLIPIDGSTTAFTFADADGNALGMTTTGKVGEQATLRIVPTQTSASEDNKARLQIVVQDRNGRRFIVKSDVLGGDYTIIQTK